MKCQVAKNIAHECTVLMYKYLGLLWVSKLVASTFVCVVDVYGK